MATPVAPQIADLALVGLLDLAAVAIASRRMRGKSQVKLRSFSWLVALVLAWAPSARAAVPDDPNPPIVALGKDTYVITRGSIFVYLRDTTKLVERARADAQKFCHDQGKEMKELSVAEDKAGVLSWNFSKAKITFKALAPGDPALMETPAAAAAPAPAAGSDLTKLEELHRSGMLADSEFDAAKKRLTERSLEELHNKGVLSDSEYEAAQKRLSER